VFAFPDGAFNPIVADQDAVYLTGYTKLYEMIPIRSKSGSGEKTPAKRRQAGSRTNGK
jgi:hypothetical protein